MAESLPPHLASVVAAWDGLAAPISRHKGTRSAMVTKAGNWMHWNRACYLS